MLEEYILFIEAQAFYGLFMELTNSSEQSSS
jgi:hypothetical protein